MEVPYAVRKIGDILRAGGYEAYAVGGCVRDWLLGRVPNDWDMTTNAQPAEMRRLFAGYRVIETGIRHGTVTVLIDGESVEVTTYRVDGAYADHRHPDTVRFTASLTEDLARRDFTINAMAYDPVGGIVDPFGGQADLKRGRIRCVGDPARRFDEDALRILRALRFASVLSFQLDPATAAQIHAQAPLLRMVSAERICVEWKKLICGAAASSVLRTYPDVAAQVLPELAPDAAVPERWAARVMRVGQGEADFAGRMALLLRGFAVEDAMRALRCDRQTIRSTVQIAAAPDWLPTADAAAARRGLADFGPDGWAMYLRTFPPEIRRAMEAETASVLRRGDCWRVDQLAIGGTQLTALGLRGRSVGTVLNDLCAAVIDGTLPNTADALLDRVKSGIREGKPQYLTQ